MDELTLDLFDIVPTRLAVAAMRDNGYKNAAYAVAELIDNAVQAGAKRVELLCLDQEVTVTERMRRRVERIAVLDNGSGMDAAVLRGALQFGNGQHLADRTGMGRFGMGLPSASISQCKRVDVWSWQSGLENALHTFIDLDDIEERRQHEVPEPRPNPVPDIWLQAGSSGAFGKSGTLVVWSKLDRCMWKQSRTIIANSEFVIGRMYRRFLNEGSLTIRMVSFVRDRLDSTVDSDDALANDPLYLMVPSSTPDPYDKEAMFRKYGEHWEYAVNVDDLGGDPHPVVIRFTYAQEEARKGHNPGDRPYGKHAARNIGISLVRAGRELELSPTFVSQYDPTDRWWGVEVDFPPALDEIFGVSNNKQNARNFSDLDKLDLETMAEDGLTAQQIKEDLREAGDPMADLIDISDRVQSNLTQIRKLLKAQTTGTRTARKWRYDDTSPEARATSATKERKEEGYYGESDEGETLPADRRREEIATDLVNAGVPQEEAEAVAEATIDLGLKYVFAHSPIETGAFFSVQSRGGAIVVKLNTDHPAHKHLLEVLEDVDEDADAEDLKERLGNALDGLKLLLTAWARFEDEEHNEQRRAALQDIRVDWGRVARQFLYRND